MIRAGTLYLEVLHTPPMADQYLIYVDSRALTVKERTMSKKFHRKVKPAAGVVTEIIPSDKRPEEPIDQRGEIVDAPSPDLVEHKLTQVTASLSMNLPMKRPKYGSLRVGMSLTFEVDNATIDEALALNEHANNIISRQLLVAQLVTARDLGMEPCVQEAEAENG